MRERVEQDWSRGPIYKESYKRYLWATYHKSSYLSTNLVETFEFFCKSGPDQGVAQTYNYCVTHYSILMHVFYTMFIYFNAISDTVYRTWIRHLVWFRRFL